MHVAHKAVVFDVITAVSLVEPSLLLTTNAMLSTDCCALFRIEEVYYCCSSQNTRLQVYLLANYTCMHRLHIS